MKKFFTALMIAAFVLSTGCGNKVEETAKDAQQKVEQEATKNADAVKDEAKKVEEKTEQAIKDTAQKAEDAKADVEQKVDEMKADAIKAREDIALGAQKMRESEGEISLGGIFPGVTVDEVKEAYGEPVKSDAEELVFENGAIVNVDTNNMVKSIRLTKPDVETPAGVAVGMSEYVLNDAYSAADKVKKLADGAEYEYDRGADKIARLVFTAKNGVISEIKTEFNK